MERLHSCSNATFVPAHSFCFALSPSLLSVPSLFPSFFLWFPLSVAGGPWGERYAAVLWSEAGGRHLPDCEAAVVEGSTGSRIRDLGQKTSRAGKLHSDCMNAEAWPGRNRPLVTKTIFTCHRSPLSHPKVSNIPLPKKIWVVNLVLSNSHKIYICFNQGEVRYRNILYLFFLIPKPHRRFYRFHFLIVYALLKQIPAPTLIGV